MRETFSDEELSSAGITSEKTKPSTNPAGQSHRVDLSERLKLKPAYNNPASEEKKPEDQTDPEKTDSSTGNKEEPEKKSSATFEDGKGEPTEEEDKFEDFANNISQKLDGVEAIELAEMIVTVGDSLRGMFGPGLYEGLAYPGQERNDIRTVIALSIENEKNNLPPDHNFNNYYKRLYSKWPDYRKSVEQIPFTEKQTKRLGELIARELGEMTVSNFLHKHMWALYWFSIEISKASPIAGARIKDTITKRFGGQE